MLFYDLPLSHYIMDKTKSSTTYINNETVYDFLFIGLGGQWYSFMAHLGWNMDIIYNIGDAVNKIGFGLVIYSLSRSED